MGFYVTARVEVRHWYVGGVYLGDASPFVPASAGGFEKHLVRAIENRRMMLENAGGILGDKKDYSISLGDWGEARIITNAVLSSAE